MHKNDFFPLYFFHITRFHSVTSNPKSFSPAATLDPRPRHWTRDRDFGPATATVDPRPATISQTRCKETKFLSLILVTTESPQDDNIACLNLLISPYLAFWTISIGHQVKLNEYVFVFTKILQMFIWS